jgi:hypothetical protein
MGHKRTWYASAIGEVWSAMRHRHEGNTLTGTRRSVFLPVTLDAGAPVKDVDRPVMIRMAPTTAIDLGYRMIREGRQARRDDIVDGVASGPLYADKHSRRGMVRRFLADYAEETGAQNDDLHAQVADLIADLLVLTDRDGVDREYVISKACEYADETD